MDDPHPITDPTDFASTPLTPLAAVDALLRCQICKDFFANAVITSCCHTFCSLCIRRSLSAEGRCPTCRTTELENKLRRNVAIQELVDSYTKARPDVLNFARTAAPSLSQDQTDFTSTRRSKRKRDVSEHQLTAEPPAQVPRTRSQRNKGFSAVASQPDHSVTVELSSDSRFSPEPRLVDEGARSSSIPQQGEIALVLCPICNTRMKEEAVYHHLDICTGVSNSYKEPPAPTPDLAAVVRPPTNHERLPQLNYSLFKDNMLRKKLSELGIPSWGPKALLIRRHTEWINLWNANCDSSRPKSRKQLQAELEDWERSQGGRAKPSEAHIFGASGPGESSSGSSIMRKDFDGISWAKQNKSDFDALIANARNGASRKASNPTSTLDASLSESPGNDDSKSAQGALRMPEDDRTLSRENSLSKAATATVDPTTKVDTSTYRSIDTGRRRSSPVPGFAPKLVSEESRESSKSMALTSPMTPPAGRRTVRRGSAAGSPVATLPTESSLPDLIFKRGSISDASEAAGSEAAAQNSNGVRKKPMFEMPGEPVLDADTAGGMK